MDKYVETLHYIAAENCENYEVFKLFRKSSNF